MSVSEGLPFAQMVLGDIGSAKSGLRSSEESRGGLQVANIGLPVRKMSSDSTSRVTDEKVPCG